jgi:hypothetical protein
VLWVCGRSKHAFFLGVKFFTIVLGLSMVVLLWRIWDDVFFLGNRVGVFVFFLFFFVLFVFPCRVFFSLCFCCFFEVRGGVSFLFLLSFFPYLSSLIFSYV